MKEIFENWKAYIAEQEESEEALNEGAKDILAAIFFGVASMIPGGLEAAAQSPVEAVVSLPPEAQQKVKVNMERFRKHIPGYERLTLPDQIKQLVAKSPVGVGVRAGRPLLMLKGKFKRDWEGND